MPVKPGDAAGECPEQGQSADLDGPGEEVGLDDTLKSGLAAEVASVEQIGGIGLSQSIDVAAERRLHYHADDGGQVGVADKEVVQLIGVAGYLSESGGQEVLP